MAITLAQRTIKRVSAALESGESAGLSEIVELIQRLSGHAPDTSVQDLATMIGKDVVVTAKVIAAANTIGYNPSGVPVSTISQAIHVIGFNKIRQLAVSLLLVENAERTLNPTEKREIAALALCSGLMAENVMTQHGTSAPEHAFICASLRNYGRLLMTSFMIEEYRSARALALKGGASEDAAFNQVFGLTPLELGHHLLASVHLPEPILKSLRTLPPDAVRMASQCPQVELLLLADLSVKLCELALRPDLRAEEFDRQTRVLADRAGRAFGLDSDGLLSVLGQTGDHLTEFAQTFGLKTLTSTLAPRLKARVEHKTPEILAAIQPLPVAEDAAAETTASAPPEETADATAAPTAEAEASAPAAAASAETETTDTATPAAAPTDAAGAHAEAKATGEEIFQRAFDTGIEELTTLLDAQPVNMDKIYRVVLRSALQGFAATEGVILVRGRSSADYTARFGHGPLFTANDGRSLVRESDRNVCGICLQRLEDVFINDASDAKIRPHIPEWLKTGTVPSFVLLPMHENRRPFALLLAAWPEKKKIGFTVGQIRQIRSILRLVGTAHRLAG